jgi:uridine phosphorylase
VIFWKAGQQGSHFVVGHREQCAIEQRESSNMSLGRIHELHLRTATAACTAGNDSYKPKVAPRPCHARRSRCGGFCTVQVDDSGGDRNMTYHLGFGESDLPSPKPTIAILSGDPGRSSRIAADHFVDARKLSDYRGLASFVGRLGDRYVIAATSGMGAPSTSIIFNELVQLGMTTIIRVGSTGAIQPHIPIGSVIVTSAALCRQGAANDIAPLEYPAAADPFLTVALVDAARDLGITPFVGVTASVDTFYEGQERTESSANKHLQRSLQGVTDEYRTLGILNYEMESGTMFKMGLVYGVAVGCVCAVIANRCLSENPDLGAIEAAEDVAISIAIRTSTFYPTR